MLRSRRVTAALLALALACAAPSVRAQDQRPYDNDVLRLSEILGSIHYLRTLCGHDDKQLWRDQMQALIKAEGTSALRRVVLTRRFNRGFSNYGRTYRRCTESAKTSLTRFMDEAGNLANKLLADPVTAARQR